MAFVAVAVPFLLVHPSPARARAPATASHQLTACFMSAAAADRARAAAGRAGRTADGGQLNLHRAIGDGS
jgi:hypothetical protein